MAIESRTSLRSAQYGELWGAGVLDRQTNADTQFATKGNSSKLLRISRVGFIRPSLILLGPSAATNRRLCTGRQLIGHTWRSAGWPPAVGQPGVCM